jgi:hypothetical protein
MHRVWQMLSILALWVTATIPSARADGMVVQQVFYPKVEIPNQQALIHFSGGTERLVIETSFLGEGTNFAWVVPLPSAPEVKPVAESVFSSLEQEFRPRLVHQVHPYYGSVLLLCGMVFLGWRSLKDEVSWVADFPLCLLLSVGAGFMGNHVVIGAVAGGLALATRLFSRTPAALALLLLIGTGLDAALTFAPFSYGLGLIQTMGSSGAPATVEAVPGVTVVSVQHAGVFDSTTIRGTDPSAVMAWLEKNGYQAPLSAEPAIRYYLEHGWVFVASKAQRMVGDLQQAALHPLLFTFSAPSPVYPTRLTAFNNSSCTIDLYVFGNRRATARHFNTVRCDRVAIKPASKPRSLQFGLGIPSPEVLALVGDSTVGTKLSARLSPKQMASDVEIHSGAFWRRGAMVFSHSGALTMALNVALPLAALGWLLMGASRGGWEVTEQWVSRWRWRFLAVAVAVGVGVFALLPKVEVVNRSVGSYEEGGVLE